MKFLSRTFKGVEARTAVSRFRGWGKITSPQTLAGVLGDNEVIKIFHCFYSLFTVFPRSMAGLEGGDHRWDLAQCQEIGQAELPAGYKSFNR